MTFVPGLELCGRFYREAVLPILERHFSSLPHAAARIDEGSEVLGFDTPMSADHDSGPRLQLFLREEDADLRSVVSERLGRELPAVFMGYPTRFVPVVGDTALVLDSSGEGEHRVSVETPDAFFRRYLGFGAHEEPSAADWLSFPQQKLLTISRGAVYADGIGLNQIRDCFKFYPHDIWLYQLAAEWTRIGQEEHLVGRAGFVGDELGAKVIAARLVRDMMRLGFLFERQYAPYPKWFGTAFCRLSIAAELTPRLEAVLRAEGWENRNAALAEAYWVVARGQNRLGLIETRTEEVGKFFGRPFSAIEVHAGFAQGLISAIGDPQVREIASKRILGGIDVFSDSTDLLSDAGWRAGVRDLY